MKFKEDKINVVVISAALLSAVVSIVYAKRQLENVERKVTEAKTNTIMKFKRVREQNVFPHPTEEKFNNFSGESCKGIAYQLEINSYSDDDFGNLSRECAVLILNGLAENVRDGETLSEYFSRKEKEC